MQRTRSTIFREEALEFYQQSRQKSVLPRIIAPSVFLFLWVVLGLCTAAVIVASVGQVPVYVHGSGIVLEQFTLTSGETLQGGVALVFVSVTPAHPLSLQAGTNVRLDVGKPIQHITRTIALVEPDVLSPSEAQKRVGSGGQFLQALTGPSIAVLVKLGPAFPTHLYADSVVNAQIQVGSCSVLSLLLSGSSMATEE